MMLYAIKTLKNTKNVNSQFSMQILYEVKYLELNHSQFSYTRWTVITILFSAYQKTAPLTVRPVARSVKPPSSKNFRKSWSCHYEKSTYK